jgi:hypothetical protein
MYRPAQRSSAGGARDGGTGPTDAPLEKSGIENVDGLSKTDAPPPPCMDDCRRNTKAQKAVEMTARWHIREGQRTPSVAAVVLLVDDGIFLYVYFEGALLHCLRIRIGGCLQFTHRASFD